MLERPFDVVDYRGEQIMCQASDIANTEAQGLTMPQYVICHLLSQRLCPLSGIQLPVSSLALGRDAAEGQ